MVELPVNKKAPVSGNKTESCLRNSIISDSKPTGVFPEISKEDGFICENANPQNKLNNRKKR